MASSPTTSPSEFSVGWKVLLASMIGVMLGASPMTFNTIGSFIGPLHKEYGWDFKWISFGVTIFGVTASLLAPLFGSWADKYGVRRVVLWSLLAFGLTFGCFAFISDNIATYFAVWLLVGLVGIGSTPVTWTRAVNMWFVAHRGLALGITLVGTSLAALFIPPFALEMIDRFGWRTAYLCIAALPLLVALPLAYLLFREPRPEERPAALTIGGTDLIGVTRQQAMQDKRFWIMFASISCVALAYGGAHIHFKEMLTLHKFSAGDIKLGLMIIGLGILVGRLLTGVLLDRFWAPLVTLPILCAPAISCFLLADDGMSVPAGFVAAGLLGFAAGAESDLIAYLAGRYFGMAHYGKIYGWLYMPFGMASAISPFLYGMARDSTGHYDIMLYAAMGLFVLGAVLLLFLGKYPDLQAEARGGS
jgi:MFS transporter, OFA family, oxalate/formate antiporter